MLKISSEGLPKLLVNDLSYLIYYTLYGIIISFFLFFIGMGTGDIKISSDSIFITSVLILGLIIGVIIKTIKPTVEKKIIKRNIFVSGLITLLKKNKTLTFDKIYKDHAYFVFQNRKVTFFETEWSYYIEALIALGIIELVNHKKLKKKDVDFDYKEFKRVLLSAELKLIDKKINTDDLIKRLDNYVL